MTPCPGIVDGRFLESTLAFIDCQAQSLGAEGYQALVAPGGSLSVLLSGMLTIFIALFGYRLLLGEAPDMRSGIVAFVKIGIVFALALSWAAYRPLVYDVVMQGPASLVADVAAPSALPGTSGDLPARLGQVDRALQELGRPNIGSALPQAAQPQTTQANDAQAPQALRPPVSDPPSIFSPYSLGTARLTFLTATIASFASVRLVAGLLLALGPLFIGFLLFEGTRSIFEGWVRGLLGTAIGAIAVTLLLSVELALLEPWLATLILRRSTDPFLSGAATELLVVAFAFALTLIAGLGMAARFAMAFRLPATLRALPGRWASALADESGRVTLPLRAPLTSGLEPPSRAARLGDTVAQIERREAREREMQTQATGGYGATAPRDRASSGPQASGLHQRRGVRNRISASAGRRDNQP
ncbi:type IV secretion system protein [Sphingomonas hengshuiensis]|uniref:Conjugal transfer protein TrbL n=1 Tax=Sphingomonas hengshuiensis TaxID=1609977 RepID=A0A7U5CUL0_9SPHN|nr:type IV secretion system protein [Sphingomonas hengshuiensis]AJP70593.1 hypothetical protein TS85_00235 [Sphingomonas hengshuiensis]